MSGHNGGTLGTRRPLGAVDPNDERFVPSTVDLKAVGVHKSAATAAAAALSSSTPQKHKTATTGAGGGLSSSSSSRGGRSTTKKPSKRSAAAAAVLGKTGGLRVLVDPPPKASNDASAAAAAGEWRHKFERMLLEKTRLESDLRAQQALVDELKAKVSAIEQQRSHQSPPTAASSFPAKQDDDADGGGDASSKRRRLASPPPESSSSSSDHDEMSDTIGDHTTTTGGGGDVDMSESDNVGGDGCNTATIAESFADASAVSSSSELPQPANEVSQSDVAPKEAPPADAKIREGNALEEEEACMGVRVPADQQRQQQESTPPSSPPADSPPGTGGLTTSQVLRFEALSRLPAHHALPITAADGGADGDAPPAAVIGQLRAEIQRLKANRTEEVNALKTFHRALEDAEADNRALREDAEALEARVHELVPLHGFVVESEILRECEQIDASRLREELEDAREDGARAHHSIAVLGKAFHAKLKSSRELVKRLRAAMRAERARANEGDFACEVAAQQLAGETERVRSTYDERIATLEARVAELQRESKRERTEHEDAQRELMSDNERQRRELARLRSQLAQEDGGGGGATGGGKKRRRTASLATPAKDGDKANSNSTPPAKRRRISATSSSSSSASGVVQQPQYSKTPPPPSSTLTRASSFARIPFGDTGGNTSATTTTRPLSATAATSSSSSSSSSRHVTGRSARTPPPPSSLSNRKRSRAARDEPPQASPLTPSPALGPAPVSSSSAPPPAGGNPPPLPSVSESLRLVRAASDTMFGSVRELKAHLADIQELLAATGTSTSSSSTSSGGSAVTTTTISTVSSLRDKLKEL